MMPAARAIALSVLVTGLVPAAPALAGEAAVKVLLDNDKAHAYEITFKPGDMDPSHARGARTVHALTKGKLLRVYPDGKTAERSFKEGDWWWLPAETCEVRNIGETTVTLQVIEAK